MPAPLAHARTAVLRAPVVPPIAPLPSPPPLARAGSRLPARRLRRSLRASTLEGMGAELVSACTGGATLTAWALHLGCSTGIVGLLGAFPFLGHVLQLPAARLTARFGARRVALVSVAVSRQAFLPLALLPLFPVAPRRAEVMLVAAAAVLHGLGIVCNNGWVAWMGELVPARVRGRYFGRRTAICTAVAAASTLSVGLLLDGSRGAGATRGALSALAALSCLAGVATTILMARQHGGRPHPAGLRGGAPFASVLSAPAPRRLAGFLAVTGVASGLAEPYVALFMLRDAGLGFGFVAAQFAVCACARVVAAPLWGRAVDGPGGARRVLLASTGVLAAVPLLWVWSSRTGAAAWMLTGAVAGAGAAGTSVATLAQTLAIAPPRERPVYHAVFSVAGGLAFGAGAALANRLAASAGAPVPGASTLTSPLVLPFACAAGLRLVCAGLGLAVLERRAAVRTAA